MKSIGRDTWIAIGLVALLVIVTILAAIQQARVTISESLASLSSESTAPEGGRALWLWAQKLGYAVDDSVAQRYAIPEETDVVLVLEPREPFLEGEWQTLDDWTREGGTLVAAGENWPFHDLARRFDFDAHYTSEVAKLAAPSPLWLSPPLAIPAEVRTVSYLVPSQEREALLPLLTLEEGYVLVSFPYGEGRVILGSAPYPFSNAGLKAPGNPELVLNVLRSASPQGRIWFDEWHHGKRAAAPEPQDLSTWLRHTPVGRSLIFATIVIVLAIALQGQRFGPPVTVKEESPRRAPLEYITAIANLNRRAGHRKAVLNYYRHHLKRELGKRYRLSPTLSDDQYVEELASMDPTLDAGALRQLLARLHNPRIKERELVKLAEDVASWTRKEKL